MNISETVTDRAISIEFLPHGVQEGYYGATQNISIFTTFGGQLEFLRKIKNLNISETVRDRAISIEFFCCNTKKFNIFQILVAVLDFTGKRKMLISQKHAGCQ